MKLQLALDDITLAAALALVEDVRTYVGIIEVGMGGRLDATNVIDGVVSAITTIGMGHMDKLGPDVAGTMITNPNTCGLFERDMKRIADAVHAAGAFV